MKVYADMAKAYLAALIPASSQKKKTSKPAFSLEI